VRVRASTGEEGKSSGGDSTLLSGVVAAYSRGELKNELEGKAVEGNRY